MLYLGIFVVFYIIWCRILFLRVMVINKKTKYEWTYKYRHHCARHQVVLLLCSCQLQILDNLQFIICSRMLFLKLNGTFSKRYYLLCKQHVKTLKKFKNNFQTQTRWRIPSNLVSKLFVIKNGIFTIKTSWLQFRL